VTIRSLSKDRHCAVELLLSFSDELAKQNFDIVPIIALLNARASAIDAIPAR